MESIAAMHRAVYGYCDLLLPSVIRQTLFFLYIHVCARPHAHVCFCGLTQTNSRQLVVADCTWSPLKAARWAAVSSGKLNISSLAGSSPLRTTIRVPMAEMMRKPAIANAKKLLSYCFMAATKLSNGATTMARMTAAETSLPSASPKNMSVVELTRASKSWKVPEGATSTPPTTLCDPLSANPGLTCKRLCPQRALFRAHPRVPGACAESHCARGAHRATGQQRWPRPRLTRS